MIDAVGRAISRRERRFLALGIGVQAPEWLNDLFGHAIGFAARDVVVNRWKQFAPVLES